MKYTLIQQPLPLIVDIIASCMVIDQCFKKYVKKIWSYHNYNCKQSLVSGNQSHRSPYMGTYLVNTTHIDF